MIAARGTSAKQRALAAAAAWLAGIALAACASPARSHPSQPAPAAPVAAEPSATPSAPAALLGNRDKHGPPDLATYIERLESDERLREMRPDFVVETLALDRGDVVADLGCGPGVFTLRFARACPAGVVYAVDVEPGQLDRLREHLLAAQVENVVPVLASYSTPHLPPASCDLIFIGDTFHHLDDRVEYMRRLRAALVPSGRLAVFEYKPGPLPVGPPPEHKLKEGELRAELEQAGYELVADFGSHPYHDFQVWRVAR